MSFAKEPLIAQAGPQSNRLVTENMAIAYLRASDPTLCDIATIQLFQELCNVFLRCANLSVYSQQAPDTSTQTVDLTVGSIRYEPAFQEDI